MTEERKQLQNIFDLLSGGVECEALLYFNQNASAEFREGADYIVQRVNRVLKSTAELHGLRYPHLIPVELKLVPDITKTK